MYIANLFKINFFYFLFFNKKILVRWAYFWKMMNRLKKRPLFLLFYTILPTIFVIFFAPIYGISDVRLAIVNNDVGNLGRSILSNIPEILIQESFSNLNEAQESLKKDKNRAIYLIPENFSLSLQSNSTKISPFLLFAAEDVRVLPSIEQAINKAFNKTAFERHLSPPNFKNKIAVKSIPGFRNLTANQSFNSSFNLTLWVVILTVVATELTFEMSTGFLERSLIAGLKPIDVFASTFVVYILISLAQSFCILHYVFLVSFKGIITLKLFGSCYVFVVLLGFWTVLFAILLALLIKNPSIVAMTSFCTFYTVSFLTGSARCQEAMKYWLHLQSLWWPSHFTDVAFLEIVVRGSNLLTKSVLYCAAMNCLWVIFVVFLIWVFRKRIY